MRSARVGLAFFAVAILAAPSVLAGDTAAAQTLFSDARKLMAAGNYADACPKLDESEKLDPGMGTLYNLGDCYEHVGKTASAWAAFDEVANEARAAGQPTREQDARARANALSPQLAHLTIDASAIRSLPGLRITRDGEEIGAPEWGSAIPIDPGAHTITATATGKTTWTSNVNVTAQEGSVVKLPILEDAPVAPPPPVIPLAPPPSPEPKSDGSTQRTTGIVLAGVGVLAVGTGMVLGLMSKNEESTANNQDGCNPDTNACPTSQGVDDRHTAIVEGNVSSVLAIGGLVLATGGIVLWATAPHPAKTTAQAWRVTPDVGVGQNGASFGMRGRW